MLYQPFPRAQNPKSEPHTSSLMKNTKHHRLMQGKASAAHP